MTDPKNPDQPTPDQNSDNEPESLPEQDAQPTMDADDDPWAAAFAEAEQDEAEHQAEGSDSDSAGSAGNQIFKPLESSAGEGSMRDLEMIMDIPVKLTVELGRTRITIKQLLELAQGSVIELDGLAGEPMDILINGYLIAQGEVVVVDDNYGIRITEIITPSERVQKLNR